MSSPDRLTSFELAYAYASIDWAELQIPLMESRLRLWLKNNIRTELRDNGADYLLFIVEKDWLPLSFSVEVGAYINALRSSLDILATALATRYDLRGSRDIYFPIKRSEKHFDEDGFVKKLPDYVRDKLKSLKPYEGGSQVLYDLHQMDNTRKHTRLLEVIVRPQTIKISGWGKAAEFRPAGQPVSSNGEILLGFVDKGVELPMIDIEPQVAISERGVSVIASVLLRRYVQAVRGVVRAFG